MGTPQGLLGRSPCRACQLAQTCICWYFSAHYNMPSLGKLTRPARGRGWGPLFPVYKISSVKPTIPGRATHRDSKRLYLGSWTPFSVFYSFFAKQTLASINTIFFIFLRPSFLREQEVKVAPCVHIVNEDCNWENLLILALLCINLVMKYVCKSINKKAADGFSLKKTAVAWYGYPTGAIRTKPLQGVSACPNLYMLVF